MSEQRNPENVTEVRPESIEDVVPPDPLQEDSGADDRSDDAAALDLSWLWPALRITGIVLLVLLLTAGPLLGDRRGQVRPPPIASDAGRAGGAHRRRLGRVRRCRGRFRARLVAGAHAQRARRRLYETPRGEFLAADADRAVFSGTTLTDAEADAFWNIVDEERRSLTRTRGVWRGILATVSLKSFVRDLAPLGVRSRFAERGSAGLAARAHRHDHDR